MIQNIVHIALVVNDYDEAIEFYTRPVQHYYSQKPLNLSKSRS